MIERKQIKLNKNRGKKKSNLKNNDVVKAKQNEMREREFRKKQLSVYLREKKSEKEDKSKEIKGNNQWNLKEYLNMGYFQLKDWY